MIGGAVALRLDPAALRGMAAGRMVVLVSGTNGKTTTARLLAAALQTREPVASNAAGSNMPAGLVTALALDRVPLAAVLEVDEGYVPAVMREVEPALVLLLNLSRDQLDRVGEVATVAGRWRQALAATSTVVIANRDDPLVAWAADAASDVVWVGAGGSWTQDSALCRSCGRPARAAGAGQGGCTCAGRRVPPQWRLAGDTLTGPDVGAHLLSLALPGRANRANAAMAVAAAHRCGVRPETSLPAMARIGSVAGRYSVVDVEGRRARLLLAKNPAGWLETLSMLAAPPTPVVLVFNARAADGRDPSWLWDVDFDVLRGRQVIVCGERRLDLAVRLRYADIPCALVSSPLAALQAVPEGTVDLIANYTAFQSVRQVLADVA